MVPFRVPIVIRHLLFRVPKKGTIILTTTTRLFKTMHQKVTVTGLATLTRTSHSVHRYLLVMDSYSFSHGLVPQTLNLNMSSPSS